MIYGPKQLADSFRTVRKHTIAIAEEIPAEQYEFRAAPEVKSAGEMLAHIAVSPEWQMIVHGERIAAVDFSKYAESMAKRKAAGAGAAEARTTSSRRCGTAASGSRRFSAA